MEEKDHRIGRVKELKLFAILLILLVVLRFLQVAIVQLILAGVLIQNVLISNIYYTIFLGIISIIISAKWLPNFRVFSIVFVISTFLLNFATYSFYQIHNFPLLYMLGGALDIAIKNAIVAVAALICFFYIRKYWIARSAKPQANVRSSLW